MEYLENKYLTYRINEYATHQPFLWHYLKKTSKPILELGSGFGSTPILHMYSTYRQIPLFTLDHDIQWLSNFQSLKSDLHTILHVDVSGDWSVFQDAIPKEIEWGLVFIDQGSWQSRVDCARFLKDKTDYIVIHDYDCLVKSYGFGKVVRDIGPNDTPGEFDMSEEFPFSIAAWPRQRPWPLPSGPPTLIASTKYSELTLPYSGDIEEDLLEILSSG